MDDLIDMMVKDASASSISDKIKDILMQKSAANIDAVRPQVAASMFGATGAEVEADAAEAELETEVESEEEETPEEETD
jgi:hypothetical protein